MSSVPRQINDGDWRLGNVESVDISYPFAQKGDGVSFEATLKITQDKLAYRPLKLGDRITIPGVANNSLAGYLVDPGTPRDIGNGLLEYRPVYASIPQKRVEPSSTVWTILLAIRDGNPITATNTFPANVVYEYSLKPFAPHTSAKYIQVQDVFYLIKDSVTGYFGGLPKKGQYVSDDSEVGIYKGLIYYRRTPYVIYPGQFLYQDGL